MKKTLLIAIIVIVANLPALSQVGIGTSDPNPSAILDLSSNTKGVLVPRMTTAERTVISNPSEGLLVYDLTTHSYWFFKGSAWRELPSGFFGDETNNTTFESDGTLVMNGNATVFNDLAVPLLAGKSTGSTVPAFSIFRNGIYTYQFEDSKAQEMFLTIQMPHDWKEGSPIDPHIHWSPMTAGSGVVRWGIEYTWANYDPLTTQVYPATTTIYVDSDPFSNAQYGSIITSFGQTTLTGGKISAILLVRIFRDGAHTNDTYNGNASGLSFDIHYESNTLGSRTEFTK